MAQDIEVRIDDGNLIIKIPVNSPLSLSKSGKSLVVATTNGNFKTDVVVEGRTLTLGLNAYIPSKKQ